MDIVRVFGTNLKKYRTKKKLSQEKFAELCDLHRTYISDIECFRRSISLENIQKIADALGIDIGDVNVKATTEEKLGFTGSGEGIAAHAVCLIEKI